MLDELGDKKAAMDSIRKMLAEGHLAKLKPAAVSVSVEKAAPVDDSAVDGKPEPDADEEGAGEGEVEGEGEGEGKWKALATSPVTGEAR